MKLFKLLSKDTNHPLLQLLKNENIPFFLFPTWSITVYLWVFDYMDEMIFEDMTLCTLALLYDMI